MKRKRTLSWKPIRAGATYCSPACGGGCTVRAYEAATKHAVKLAKSIGRNWEPFVWENLGWHYKARRGQVSVHPIVYRRRSTSDKIIGYHAYNESAFVGEGRTPIAALTDLLAQVRKDVKCEVAKLVTLEEACR